MDHAMPVLSSQRGLFVQWIFAQQSIQLANEFIRLLKGRSLFLKQERWLIFPTEGRKMTFFVASLPTFSIRHSITNRHGAQVFSPASLSSDQPPLCFRATRRPSGRDRL